MDKKQIMKVGAGVLGAVVIAGAGLGVGAMSVEPEQVEVPVIEYQSVTEFVEVPVEVIKEVEVSVDNGNMDLVLEHLYDNDGNVEYLIDDLDDDELGLIVDRVVFINDVRAMALAEVEKNGIDELHKEYVGEVRIDEDDVERFKLYDEDEDLVVEDIDFEDGEAEVLVKVRFQLDDDEAKYGALYRVSFEEGKLEDLDLEEVYVRE